MSFCRKRFSRQKRLPKQGYQQVPRSWGSNDPGVFETQKRNQCDCSQEDEEAWQEQGLERQHPNLIGSEGLGKKTVLFSKYDGKSLETIIRKPDDLIHISKNRFGCVMDSEHCLRLYFFPIPLSKYGVLPWKLNSRSHLNASRLGCHLRQGKAGSSTGA